MKSTLRFKKQISIKIKVAQTILSFCVFALLSTANLFAQESINFTGLGPNDSGGSGFKSINDNRIIISNNVILDGTLIYQYIQQPNGTFIIKADGINAKTFTIHDIIISNFMNETMTGGGSIKLYGEDGTVLKTLVLNESKYITTTPTSGFNFFGGSDPVNKVAKIELMLVEPNQNFQIENISASNFARNSTPTVTTSAATSITATGATLSGNVTDEGGAIATERGFVYATSSNPTTSDTKVQVGSGTGPFSEAIIGLDPETTYYVRAYAINGEGTSYGSEESFTTSAAPSGQTTLEFTGGYTSIASFGASPRSGNLTMSEDGINYTFESVGGGSGVIVRNTTGDGDAITFTMNPPHSYYSFKRTDGSNFQLDNLNIEFNISNVTTATLTGYVNGSAVIGATESITFTQSVNQNIDVSGNTNFDTVDEFRITFPGSPDNNATTVLSDITYSATAVPALDPIQSLYWPNENNDKIEGISLTGSSRQDIVTIASSGSIIAIDIDHFNEKAYWFDQTDSKIYRSNLDGTGIEEFVSDPSYATTLFVDHVNGYLYWPNSGSSKIERIKLDGTGREDVISTTDPIGISVDVSGSKVYWYDQTNGSINRGNLDGSGSEEFISDPGYATTVYIDQKNNYLYWPNYDDSKIERIKLDGTGREDVTSATDPIGISVDVSGSKVYWYDSANDNIGRANLDGTGSEVFISSSGYATTLSIPWEMPANSAPIVATSSVSAITATGATLSGNVTNDGGDTVTERGFVHSSSDNTPTIGGSGVTQISNGSGTGTFEESVSGLSVSTNYYYQAYATNAEGTSYGGVETFKTLPTPTATGSITITEDSSDPSSTWILSEGKLIPLVDGAKVNVNEVTNALASGDLIIEAETDVIIDANITPSLLENRTLTLKANRDINLEDNSSIAVKDFSLNIVLWSDADALEGGVSYLKNQTEIFTHGGHLWIGGGSGSTVWNGLRVGNSTAVGNTNNSNGISLIKTNINTDGGNIAFYGRGLSGSIAGTPTPISTGNSTNTNGIRMHDGNFINAGSGTIYMYGFADNSYGSSNVNGVELSHTPGAPDLITSSNNTENAILIEGYAQGPTTVANSWGFYTHLSTIENTGGGTIHIKGSAVRNSGVTVAQNGAVLANNGKIILEGTGAGGTNPNVLVQGAIGQKANSNVESSNANIEIIGDRFSISGNIPNGRIQSSGILSLRPYTSGIDIGVGSASGTLEIPAPYFQNNFVNGFSEIIIGDEQTGPITVGGTIVYKDLLTIKTNKNIVLTSDANMSSATANALTLWSRAGGDNEANDTNFGAIWMQQGSSIHTGGGNLTMGGGSNPSIGYAMGDHSSGSAENNAIYRGVAMNGTVNAAGGNIIINGKGSSNISHTRGVNIAGSVSTSGAGTITIEGIGRGASDAIALGDSSFNPAAIGILKTDTGTINLEGKPSSSTRNGLNISTSGSYIRTNGNFSVTTTGRITATAGALNVGGNTHLEATDNITMTHTTNDFVGPMVVNVASNLQLTDQNELTLGEISVSGTIEIATLEGDLTISGNISTTNATADAIQIFAGKNKIAGNPLGGSIKINGTPEVTTGTGGQAKLYSGAILQSADLISLTGENNARYNVDANTSTFDPELGSGNYALIREKKNDPPTAINVNFSGVLTNMQELTGSYDYNDAENDPETGTSYQWYRADDSNGTNQSAIVGADKITYILSTEDIGKFISFEVTPNNSAGKGNPVESRLKGAVAEILSASVSSSTNVSCNGESDGSATVSVTGGIEPYYYNWNDPSGSTTATIGNLVAGSYEVKITDSRNQETTASVTITEPTIYTVDAPDNVVACDSYSLPALTEGNYYTQPNGLGTALFADEQITTSQTLYVYGENENGCSDENSFAITINKNEIQDVTFSDVEVIYDGEEHTLSVMGLPELASVVYDKNNSYTNAGSYTITATVSSAHDICADRVLSATLLIKKAESVITTDAIQMFTYDGNVKDVSATLNHSETQLAYAPQQGYTDAGTYPVSISSEETDNYLSASKEVALVIENAEITGVAFESETFTYDGTAKSIAVTGLPEGATVDYENINKINAGTYKVTATVSQENYNDKVLTADFVIKKAESVITADAIQTFTYDGTVKDVSATLNHSETQLTYTPQQGYTNAGTYPVTISSEETDNYLSASKEVSLVIENAEIEGVTFEGDTFIYDGTTKSIAVTGLPEGATVTYENNGQINAGTYKVTATVSQENYNDKVLTTDLIIEKAEALITAEATQTFTYDGTVKNVAATLNHPETGLAYAPQQGYTNAGTYPVTISSEETDNYLSASKEVSLVIESAEIEGVTFEGGIFTYDGTTKSISIAGLPEGASVTYENNEQINAGTYTVTATVSQENYNNKILTADLIIEKAESVITADAIQTFTYDGTVKNVAASLNHSETQLAYAPQKGYTNAGTYPVSISSEETDNYLSTSKEVSLVIENAEIEGVAFEGDTFIYDGTTKSIAVTGLSEGATVTYENNGQINAGTYKVTATVSQENYNNKILTADLSIEKAEPIITAEATQTFTYDGTVKNAGASLNHSETQLAYTPQQGYTNAGTYPVSISSEETDNYLSASKEVSLVIENAEIEGVTFEGDTFIYNGTTKSIAVTGLPEGAYVSYENNDKINSGTYTVTATVSQDNYNDKVLTADLVINKAQGIITADAVQSFTYDGTVKNVAATLNHSETQLAYTPQQGYTNAGTYPVSISSEETDNYLSASKEVSLVIENAEIEGVTFEGGAFIYDGTTKSIAVTGLPEGASVSYEINDKINAGTYTVTAKVSQQNYNDKVLTADLVIKKAEAVITADATQTFTYDGTVKNVAASLNHSETTLIYAPAEGYINAGTYPVTISSEETDNYLSALEEVSLVIENAEIEGVTFEDDTFTYDGETHSLAVTGLPVGATVDYENNDKISAGSYKVTATVIQENYNDKVLTADLEINKAEAVITADATQTFTYDGTVKNVVASLNHSETTLIYAPVQGYMNAGTFPVTVASVETDNYLSASKEVSLEIAKAEIEGVTFEGDAFTYDGTTKSIEVTGLPEAATVTYSNNGKTNAGTYRVTATVSQSGYEDLVLTANMLIEKASQSITFNELEDLDQLTDEYLQLEATSTSGLPVMYSYTYETEDPAATVGPRGFIRILSGGQITITATQAGNQNYEAAVSVVRTLTISGSEARLNTAVINGVTYSNPTEDIYYLIGCGSSENEVEIQLEQNRGATIDSDNIFTMSTPVPGIYRETVIVTSGNGNLSTTYNIVVEKNFNFEDIVVQKFNNVLLVNNNPETNGGYKFVSYRWYKDGSVVGKDQYYSAGDHADDQLDAVSEYYVVLETEDGEFLRTCNSAIQLRSSLNVALAPNPVSSGGTMELLADFPKDELETMNLSIHNLNGMLIRQMKSNSKSTSITLPYNLEMGVYILKIETKNIRKSLKFIIK